MEKKDEKFEMIQGFIDSISYGKMQAHRVDLFFVLHIGGVMVFEQFRN